MLGAVLCESRCSMTIMAAVVWWSVKRDVRIYVMLGRLQICIRQKSAIHHQSTDALHTLTVCQMFDLLS